jgi:excisionase family DNA binding protein
MTKPNTRSSSPPSQLIDIVEAATRLGVPVRHVRRLVAERRVPYVKWGARLHFDPQELDDWIDRHRVDDQTAS